MKGGLEDREGQSGDSLNSLFQFYPYKIKFYLSLFRFYNFESFREKE